MATEALITMSVYGQHMKTVLSDCASKRNVLSEDSKLTKFLIFHAKCNGLLFANKVI